MDLWTSKNSVFAFGGVKGFWINDQWILKETVLDLIPVDGDHSGAGVGKRIFEALKKRGVSKKICDMSPAF